MFNNESKMGLKRILTTGLTALVLACGGSGPIEPDPTTRPPVTQPPTQPVNRAPQTILNVGLISGVAPLEDPIQYSCTDLDGIGDITQSYLVVGKDTLRTVSIDSTFTFNESKIITGYCRDKSGSESRKGPINVEVSQPPQPTLSQTVGLSNFEDINYSVTFTNAAEAKREIFHDGNLISTDTISVSPYTQTLVERLSGNWRFIGIPIAPNAKPDTVSLDVPDYDSEAPDLSQLNLDMNEGDSLFVDLERATDKNTVDNPVRYISVTSLDGRVIPTIGSFPEDSVLTIKAVGTPGFYQIELSREGSLDKIILQGEIFDLPHISGYVQNVRTNSLDLRMFESVEMRVYNAADSTFLRKVETDNQGYFDFKLDNPISEILLQTRLDKVIPAGIVSGFVRTIHLPGRDTTGVLIRAYPHNEALAEAGITRASGDFRKYMEEINSFSHNSRTFFTDFKADSVEIIDVDPFGRGSFTPEFQNLIKSKILDPKDITCYVEGRLFHVQIDTPETPDSGRHYTQTVDSRGELLVPDAGWVVVTRDTTLVGSAGYARRHGDDRAEVVLKWGDPNDFRSETLISHEFGHIFIAPSGHSVSVGGNGTIMTSISLRTKPGPADCEAAKVIYEDTYRFDNIDIIAAGVKYYDEILGLDFLPF